MLKNKIVKPLIVLKRDFNVLKEAKRECSLRTRTIKDKSKYNRSFDRKQNKINNF